MSQGISEYEFIMYGVVSFNQANNLMKWFVSITVLFVFMQYLNIQST